MKRTLTILGALLLSGCATTSDNYGKMSNTDTFEEMNRGVYRFNKTIDSVALRPVAVAYDKITPDVIDQGIGNFFSNLGEPSTIVNGLLQGKFRQAGQDTLRFLTNSTFGMLGFIDIAGEIGWEKNDEDFGQTLAVWGVESGTYIMLPFFGPTTFRNLPSKVVEYHLDPLKDMTNEMARYSLNGLNFINIRQGLLNYDELLDEALDEYTFVKDAYLKNREFKIYDGKPPMKPLEEEFQFEECDPTFDEFC
jgi:phospholipid-binding lipoprotein MlaA